MERVTAVPVSHCWWLYYVERWRATVLTGTPSLSQRRVNARSGTHLMQRKRGNWKNDPNPNLKAKLSIFPAGSCDPPFCYVTKEWMAVGETSIWVVSIFSTKAIPTPYRL